MEQNVQGVVPSFTIWSSLYFPHRIWFCFRLYPEFELLPPYLPIEYEKQLERGGTMVLTVVQLWYFFFSVVAPLTLRFFGTHRYRTYLGCAAQPINVLLLWQGKSRYCRYGEAVSYFLLSKGMQPVHRAFFIRKPVHFWRRYENRWIQRGDLQFHADSTTVQ